MKKLLLFLLLSPIFSFAQHSRGYFNVGGEMFNYKHIDPCFGAAISMGLKGKIMSAGGGIIYTQLPHTTGPYVPVFAEIMLYPQKHDLRPYFNLQAGYAFYSEQVYGIGKQTGGLFLRPGAGLLLPIGRHDLYLRGSYVHSEFGFQSTSGQKIDGGSSNGWTFNLGVSL